MVLRVLYMVRQYGNSEVNDKDDGAGAMEAVYFGNAHWANNTGASTKDHPVHYNDSTSRPYGGGPWM